MILNWTQIMMLSKFNENKIFLMSLSGSYWNRDVNYVILYNYIVISANDLLVEDFIIIYN